MQFEKYSKTTSSLFILCAILGGLFLKSCDDASVAPQSTDKPLQLRSSNYDSLAQEHNDIINYIYENYRDSMVHYAPSPTDYMNFVERKAGDYLKTTYSEISDSLVANDTLVNSLPSNFHSSSVSAFPGTTFWNQEELDSVDTIFDDMYRSVITDGVNKSQANSLISTRISNIDAEDFPHEKSILATLTQLEYSVDLAFDINEEESGTTSFTFGIPCIFIAAVWDTHILAVWAGGEEPSPLDWRIAQGSSNYQLAKCFP